MSNETFYKGKPVEHWYAKAKARGDLLSDIHDLMPWGPECVVEKVKATQEKNQELIADLDKALHAASTNYSALEDVNAKLRTSEDLAETLSRSLDTAREEINRLKVKLSSAEDVIRIQKFSESKLMKEITDLKEGSK